MQMRQFNNIAIIVLSVTLLLMFGCGGGGGGSTETPTTPTTPSTDAYTITGKINYKATIPGATVYVELIETSFEMYGQDGRIGATPKLATPGKFVKVDSNGSYTFTGVPVSSYTIRPASNYYAFNPSESGAFTISGPGTVTGDSTVYVYDPTLLHNSVIGTTTIYNSSFQVGGNILDVQDFSADIPAGGGVTPNPLPPGM